MIGDLLKKIFGDKNTKDKKFYWPYVEEALAFNAQIKNLSDDELREKTRHFKDLIQKEKLSLENEISELRKEADDINTAKKFFPDYEILHFNIGKDYSIIKNGRFRFRNTVT